MGITSPAKSFGSLFGSSKHNSRLPHWHKTPPFVPTLQGSFRQAPGTSDSLTNITTVQIAKWGSIRSDRLGTRRGEDCRARYKVLIVKCCASAFSYS